MYTCLPGGKTSSEKVSPPPKVTRLLSGHSEISKLDLWSVESPLQDDCQLRKIESSQSRTPGGCSQSNPPASTK